MTRGIYGYINKQGNMITQFVSKDGYIFGAGLGGELYESEEYWQERTGIQEWKENQIIKLLEIGKERWADYVYIFRNGHWYFYSPEDQNSVFKWDESEWQNLGDYIIAQDEKEELCDEAKKMAEKYNDNLPDYNCDDCSDDTDCSKCPYHNREKSCEDFCPLETCEF